MKKLRYLLLLFALLIPQSGLAYDTYVHNPFDITSPAQTDDSTPFITSASSTYSGSYFAWLAFDHNSAGYSVSWASADHVTGDEWLRIDIGISKEITSYSISIIEHAFTPKDWTLQGSNDNGSTWTPIDSQTGVTFIDYEMKTFILPQRSAGYTSFRLLITGKYQSYRYIAIGELELISAPATTKHTINYLHHHF